MIKFYMKANGKSAVCLANAGEVKKFEILGIAGIKKLDNHKVIIQRLVDSSIIQEGRY
tara:strand:- start:56 stop:229 length:174 start_codon:yes stop_codon:yes gene_type:complete